MSLNHFCDNCKEMVTLLSKYNESRNVDLEGYVLDKEDLYLIINYINIWPKKQCACCYKDFKNFLRFNNLVQSIIQSSFRLLKSILQSSNNSNLRHSSCLFNQWTTEDKEKLLQLASKAFQLTFPLYITYKHANFTKNEELSPKEIKILSNYCDITDFEMPILLMRKIIYFIEASGFSLYINCFKEADPIRLPLSFANALMSTIHSLKCYFNLSAINCELASLRTHVINYLCKIQDSELRNATNRNMFEFIWSMVKEYNFNNFGIDEDGLKIAFKHFTSSTLTMRLSGLNQINSYISIYNDLSHSSMNSSIEQIREELNFWLIENKIIENIFGPNSHVEVIKQSHFILNFIASKITTEHIDIIWSAAQLKHYERYIFEILCQLIKNLKIQIVYYLYSHLWKIKPKDYSEHTLNLASQVIKYIWFYNGIQPDIITNCAYIPNEKINFDDSILNKNSLISSLFKERTTKTNSSSASSIEVSDEEEDEEFDVTLNSQQIHVDKSQVPKINSEECSNNTSESDFEMEINDNLSKEKEEHYLKITDVSTIDDSSTKNNEDTTNVLSLVWSMKNNEKVLAKKLNHEDNEINKMDMDFELLDDDSLKNKSNDMFDQNSKIDANTIKNDNIQFRIMDVYKPGNTLLWDILQDEMLNQLNEDIASAAEKIFWNTICCASNQEIRLKFIIGCLNNLSNNTSVITSIRLLQKLFSSFYQYQEGKIIRKILIDCEKHKNMLKLFFNNLSLYMSLYKDSNMETDDECDPINPLKSKFHSPKEEIQIRLNFLSFIFIYAGSHENLSFSQEHVNILWDVFTSSVNPEILDEFFDWLLNQVKLNNCLNIDIIKHILFEKMPLLKPESFSLISLELLQNLHGFILSKSDENSKTFNIVVKLLWDIAFKNPNQDVSMNASRHLNNYYINLVDLTNQFDKGEDFIRSCMNYLKDASMLLPLSCNRSLLIIERAVILLKTYLEVFYARYSYFFRTLKLSSNFGAMMHRIRDKNEPMIRVLVTSPFNDKNNFEFSVLDHVGDLRAEVQYWWKCLQKEKSDSIERQQLEKLICLVWNDHEVSFEYDDKRLLELNFKDTQLNQISFHICKQTSKEIVPLSLSDDFFEEFKMKNPKNLLLESNNFELLFILMQQLDTINMSNLKARILSRNIWEIIQILPTSHKILEKFNLLESNYNNIDEMNHNNHDNCDKDFKIIDYEKMYQEIFSSNSNQKLIYACQLVENYKKIYKNWPQIFLETGGIKFLYKLLINVVGSVKFKRDWTEWKQDCLASLSQILFHFAIIPFKKDDTIFKFDFDKNCEQNNLTSCTNIEGRKNKRLRKNSLEKNLILKFNSEFLSIIEDKEKLLDTIMTILNYVFINSKLIYQTSIWSRAQVVFVTLSFFTSWCYSDPTVFDMFFESKNTQDIIKKLILEDVDQMVRKESSSVLLRLYSSFSADKCIAFVPKFLNLLLSFLEEASMINVNKISNRFNFNEEKETFGPGNKDYFFLVCRLVDHLFSQKINFKNEIDAERLSKIVADLIFKRENFEWRKNQTEDEGLKGLFSLLTVLLKNNPHLKTKSENKELIIKIFDCLFSLPTMKHKDLPKCKNVQTRATAFELLLELVKGDDDNYVILTNLLINQHHHEILGRTSAYPWEYWPHDESRSDFVGLTNLGATCYMASCMQHLFMLNEARNAILTTNLSTVMKHESILRELQKMFIFLQESERKAYNPKNFCKVYTMDHQPLNVCEQKDMTEFFTDLITKLEEMTVDLKDMVKKHFSGLQSNNVVSLDCSHISQTTEEFYTLRCQVADMRDLYESLNELTVKDTLDGDNMYNCSECGKKVRAEKRACIKKLPKILCFNTMRYTFNMVTMTKEKVNTHFSFPFTLDMAPYLEKNLLNLPDDNRFNNQQKEETCTKYDLIGVTVHTGTAEGGHYYSFIQDRGPHSSTLNKWFLFNDAEVKLFDKTQIATECFGGEMTSKTYDKTNDKFLDFSFEKTNSAYMLFYEKCEETNESEKNSSTQTTMASYENISQDLIDWIWNDNISFIRDKLIFEHAYFDFVWRVCAQTPQTFSSICSNKSTLISTRLATLFVLETLIHAKEKPTIANWIELLTKQFNNSRNACEWLMNHLSENDWWSIQILFKCSNQMVRQLFVRLCIHVIVKLKPIHSSIYLHPLNSRMNEDVELYSCVTRFIRRLISLINVDVMTIKPNIKYLSEYFSFLLEFAKQGDEECRFLLSIETISTVINFYMNYGKIFNEFNESLSDNEEEDFDERNHSFRPILDEKFPKLASLDKMISLIVYLIEKTQNRNSHFILSKRDFDTLISSNSFQFIQQQIRDNINLGQTFNLICSICHLEEALFSTIINMIFSSIIQFPESNVSFFKILSLIIEANWIAPYFSKLILPKIWELAEHSPLQTLEWLNQYVQRNKILHDHVLSTLDHWVIYFLVENSNLRVRTASAQLLIALVPSTDNSFRQNFRPFRVFPYSINKDILLNKESLAVVDQLFSYLLSQIKKIKSYWDLQTHGTQKLSNYFYVLTYLMINTKQKRLFIAHFNDFWLLFQTKLSEPAIPIHQNKQAFLMFWYIACQECKDSIKCIVQNPHVYKKIAFNYILADHEDQDVILFNKNMLPYYYGLLRLCCEHSRTFTRYLASHQNIQWAFKNITPYLNHYLLAIQELFNLIRIFSTIPEDASEHEIKEIVNFKTMTFKLYLNNLDPNVHWGTIISVLNILIDSIDDLVFVIRNNGFYVLFQSFSALHAMFHQATACHITNELIDVLKLISSLLSAFEQHFENLSDCRTNIKTFLDVRKVICLLNSYTPSNLRNAVFEVLLKLIKVFPNEYLTQLTKFILFQHIIFAEQQFQFTPGPYFPKRGQKTFQTKSSMRPSRPIFQMCFNINNIKSDKIEQKRDKEYEKLVFDFYNPYYLFVEEVFRFAIKKDLIFDDLIDLSIRLAWESLYFHCKNFILIWLDIYENPEFKCPRILDYLQNNKSFNEYIKSILIKERSFLNDDTVYHFMLSFLNKFSQPINIRNKRVHLVRYLQSIIQDLYPKSSLEEKAIVEKLTWDLLAVKLIIETYDSLKDPNDITESPNANISECFNEEFRFNLKQYKKFYSDFKTEENCEQNEKTIRIDDSENENTMMNDEESTKFLFYEEPYCLEETSHNHHTDIITSEDVIKIITLIDDIINLLNNFS